MQSSSQNDPMAKDIAAINRSVLELIARYGGTKPENVCLRLNISLSYLETVLSLSNEQLQHVSNLGQFMLQPVIEPDVLSKCTQMTPEQAQIHMRSATRFIRGGFAPC